VEIASFLDHEPAIRAAIGLGLGLIAGSFIATILIRWPEGRSVVAGRSRCDNCDAALGLGDLVPLFSWLIRRGRCRQCGTGIDPRHPAIETAAGMIGMVSLLGHMLPLAAVTALLGWWLLLVAVLDLEHQWLPYRLTLPLIPLGLASGWAGFGPSLTERIAGAAIGWACLFLIAWLYRRLRGRDGLGGGDPKLLGAIGAWIGIWNLPFILLGAGLFGIAAIVLMRLRGEKIEATSRLPLGTLMVLAAWPVWLVVAQGGFVLF
jgi:leader peptidase (prepilin peptidase)/N-methyltransferase